MKLTVLGKYGPYAAAGGGTSSYLVSGEKDNIVLDFGSGAMSRLTEYVAIEDISAIVLSHLHYDHICDLLPLGYYLKAKNRTVKLIMPNTVCFQRELINELDGLEIIPVCENMQAGEFNLRFEKMCHPLESFSVKASFGGRTLFYSGDTSFCPQLLTAAKGSNLMLLDCGKADGSPAPHLSLSEAAFVSKSLDIPAIASHLNPELSYHSGSPSVIIAEEKKTYNV